MASLAGGAGGPAARRRFVFYNAGTGRERGRTEVSGKRALEEPA